MTPGVDALLDAHARRRIRTIGQALVGWDPGSEHFERAVADTVELHGYAAADVRAQLVHVARERCSAEALGESLELELAGVPLRGRAPGEVLQLVASTVPGLALESVLVAYAIGARSQVRPSREETVLGHFIAHAAPRAPALAGTIDLVADLRWSTPDAAVVYGSDETVAFVRERMGHRPVAAYGSREGIAVVAPGAADGWAEALADDVLSFRQRGCMSPSHLFALGSPGEQADLVGTLRAAIGERLPLHVTTTDTAMAARATADDAALASISGERPTLLELPPVALRLHYPDADERLTSDLRDLGPLLQTAVLAAAPDRVAALTERVRAAGCTRVTTPGTAHFPPPTWPHDGIGRFAPLLA